MTQEKRINGRKRHLVLDTLGLVWAVIVTPASVQDRDGGQLVLTLFREQVKFPKVIWADAAYQATARWALLRWLWCVELVQRILPGFHVLPKRWIVQRTFGWLNRYRRLCPRITNAQSSPAPPSSTSPSSLSWPDG